MSRNILDLSKSELESWLLKRGLKRFVLSQLLQWLYRKRVRSFEEMTNLSKEARGLLSKDFEIRYPEVGARHRSAVDGVTKYLFRLADGNAIESVLIPQKNRLTLCLSSQVGCAMGCKFCKTAEMRLVRNLTQGEILGQVLAVQEDFLPRSGPVPSENFCLLASRRRPKVSLGPPDLGKDSPSKITNIVMMGMGEPLHNYETVIHALEILTDDVAFGISPRKITVSTVGLAPEMERFGKETKVKLALSLNATTDEGRLPLMPIARKYPLERVIEACRTYAFGSKRKVTLEYVLMAGVNDTNEDIKRLARIASHVPCKINLIPYNEYPGSPFRRPPEETVRLFFRSLADRHFQVNIRYSKGLDVLAACGQLGSRY